MKTANFKKIVKDLKRSWSIERKALLKKPIQEFKEQELLKTMSKKELIDKLKKYEFCYDNIPMKYWRFKKYIIQGFMKRR